MVKLLLVGRVDKKGDSPCKALTTEEEPGHSLLLLAMVSCSLEADTGRHGEPGELML